MPCPLATLDEVKTHLDLCADDDDVLLNQLISFASATVEAEIDRSLCDADYIEFFRYAAGPSLVLKNTPLNHVTRIATGRSSPLTVSYSGAAIRALITVTNTGVRLTSNVAAGTATVNNLTFATYPTISTLVTAINLVSGWTATLVEDGMSNNLYRIGSMNAKGRTVNMDWPDYDLDLYEVDYSAGIIHMDRSGDWAHWSDLWRQCGHAMVEYNGGYTTIPDDIRSVTVDLVASMFARKGSAASTSTTSSGSSQLTSESIGDYSYTRSSSTDTGVGSATVDRTILNGAEAAGVLAKYRRLAAGSYV